MNNDCDDKIIIINLYNGTWAPVAMLPLPSSMLMRTNELSQTRNQFGWKKGMFSKVLANNKKPNYYCHSTTLYFFYSSLPLSKPNPEQPRTLNRLLTCDAIHKSWMTARLKRVFQTCALSVSFWCFHRPSSNWITYSTRLWHDLKQPDRNRRCWVLLLVPLLLLLWWSRQ